MSLPVSDQKFYQLSAYVKVPGASVTPADITLRYRFETSGNRVDVGTQTISTEAWTQLQSGWITPGAGDTYVGYFEVHSAANAVVFYADDCAMTQSDGYLLSGVVVDTNGTPVAGAQMQLKQSGTVIKTTTTLAGGAYTFPVQPVVGDAYTLNASKINYSSPATDVDVTSAAPSATVTNIVLTKLELGTISGIVTNGVTGLPITNATITIVSSGGTLVTNTGADGRYSVVVASGISYNLTAVKFPLSGIMQSASVATGGTAEINFGLNNSLLVAVYAKDLANGVVNAWTNKGTLGGNFVLVGANKPVAGQNGTYQAAKFANSSMVLSNEAGLVFSPSEINGSAANYTVSAWLYSPAMPDQQTYIAWAKRGGPNGSNCEMVYGTNPTFGAAGHWGAPDMAWATPPTSGAWHNVIVTWDSTAGLEKAYIAGVLSKTSPVKTLDIAAGLPIVLGAGYWWDGAVISPDVQFNDYMAQVEVYGVTAAAADVAKMATNTPPVLAVGTISGTVTTSDASSPTNVLVTAKDGVGAVVAQTKCSTGGTYSLGVAAPASYTVNAYQVNSVVTPGPQVAAVIIGGTTTINFTVAPSMIQGVLVDAITGAPIYNGVVQSGGVGGPAVVTGTNGAYTLGGTGAGGIEVFADALGYHCTNLLITASGSVYKKIALVPQVEGGCVTNGGFEGVVGGLPTSWIQGWDVPATPVTITEFWATNVPYSGTNSVFVTGAAAYEPLSQFIPADPSSVYNCYFKAVGTNVASAGAVWFPMFAFRDSAFNEMKGWISGEPAPYMWWSHNAPTNWMQYLLFQTYSGDAIQPFVRIAPPAGAVWLSATFCFTGSALTSDQGVFVDDVVMDVVPANVPLVSTTPDPIVVSVQTVGGNLQLTWPVGSLLQSTNVVGPWTTNTTATSPYTVTNSGVGNMFFKVQVR